MDEMYRILGREHEADLERDALKWRRASEARAARRELVRAGGEARRRTPTRAVALLARAARAVAYFPRLGRAIRAHH
jgi:hypothetical protein